MNPIKEAAEALGVSRDVIYCMVYRGVLPHNRTQGKGKKGKILIPKKALEKWLMGKQKIEQKIKKK
ncbi:helix-turn-helix domain-containing protein [Caldanaerobacter subterraneus]|uniref:Excisionase family DNA binding protein n=1 Tax=Caldanaerobacter subterraneus TaxID=911092 RepID=A0A4R2JPB3_9THEO|nr:helix-turn-helix domain-containing protein [Caldanaerobacter subterraneus]TCO58998.1 excisionase family DNA binding protein [Caldanaerobacter subterraneus]